MKKIFYLINLLVLFTLTSCTTVISDSSYLNISSKGVLPGNVDATIFNEIIDEASMKEQTIYIPSGEYIFSDTINLKSNVSIIGDSNTILKLDQDSESNNLIYIGELVDNVYLSHLVLSDIYTSIPTNLGERTGIYLSKSLRVNIENVEICGFDNCGLYATQTASNNNAMFYKMLQITNCRFYNNYYGMRLGNRCEYTQTLNCVFAHNNIGCLNEGGNNQYVSCIYNFNNVGFMMNSKNISNPAHGGCTACTFNHNHKDAIQVNDCTIGWLFTGCQIFYGNVKLNNSSAVIFDGCIFGSCRLYSTNSKKNVNLISNSFFQTSKEDILKNNDGSTKVEDCLPDELDDIYILSFDTQGGSEIDAQYIEKGTLPFTPTAPTKKNYEFMGWYLDKEGTNKYSFETALTSDLVVYAKWELLEGVSGDYNWTILSESPKATLTGGPVVYFANINQTISANTHIDYIDVPLGKKVTESAVVLDFYVAVVNKETNTVCDILVDVSEKAVEYSDRLETYVLRTKVDKEYDFDIYFIVGAKRTGGSVYESGLGIGYNRITDKINFLETTKPCIGDIITANCAYEAYYIIYQENE